MGLWPVSDARTGHLCCHPLPPRRTTVLHAVRQSSIVCTARLHVDSGVRNRRAHMHTPRPPLLRGALAVLPPRARRPTLGRADAAPVFEIAGRGCVQACVSLFLHSLCTQVSVIFLVVWRCFDSSSSSLHVRYMYCTVFWMSASRVWFQMCIFSQNTDSCLSKILLCDFLIVGSRTRVRILAQEERRC